MKTLLTNISKEIVMKGGCIFHTLQQSEYPCQLKCICIIYEQYKLWFSAIGFSETWLNSSSIDTYGIDGYSHIGLVRESGKGGGVSLFVCDKMVYYEMSELTMMCDYIECVSLRSIIWITSWLLGLSTDHPIVTWLTLMTLCMIYWKNCSPSLLYYGRFQSRSPKTWTTSPNRKMFRYHVC